MKTALRPRPAATASPAPQSQLQSQLQPQPQPRSLVTWNLDPAAYCSAHEHATRSEFARRLAVLTGCTYAGDYDERQPYATAPYFVPSNTVTDAGLAQAMGIAGVHDLFGGVVPHPFIATKAITHPVAGAGAPQPAGWNPRFAPEIAGSALAGFSCFSRAEARRAGRTLLGAGVVRIKPVTATGGRGQVVAHSADALDRCIDAMDEADIASHGVVIEENLERPVTYSVGQVIVARMVVSYYGQQRLARDNAGEEVYGGSDLTLVRGDFEALLATADLAPPLRHAIDQARRYHRAVIDCYPGFFASRTNYDVAQGTGHGGAWRSGVLEQSWRVGGATGAEIAALESFHADPARERVRASTFEVYGPATVPAHAIVSYQGVDPQVGPLAKYTLLNLHADSP
ncbi:DUF3182 family protein [Variovorax paradoxus]|uniref:Biotin carboxylase n=1 Tax=Variovorax paradoxus (strain EPS) TaxID=595537 RepID=E6V6Y3_VARPE|nr:DUF3182 family protein [Variovorax paradoxus]ADU37187.1 biotin carboxylase [Variovorax paradoxus EPS]